MEFLINIFVKAIKFFNTKNSKFLICHLGNDSSIIKVLNGKLIDSSMGLILLEGEIMWTSSGSIDSPKISYLQEKTNFTT